MNNNFLVLRFGLVILLSLLLLSCDNSDDFEEVTVLFDRENIADRFGNKDGITSSQELLDLDQYFETNDEAWCISNCPSGYRTGSEIPSEVVSEKVYIVQGEPYPSEKSLRQANDGMSIKTPYITISVLRSDSQITLFKIYRSPGPRFAKATWTRMRIVP